MFTFGILGGTSIWLRQQGDSISSGDAPEQLFFHVLDTLPLSQFTPILGMVIIAIFFITSADSASIVMGTLSQRGNSEPTKGVTIFWGLAMMGIAVVMLLVGYFSRQPRPTAAELVAAGESARVEFKSTARVNLHTGA